MKFTLTRASMAVLVLSLLWTGLALHSQRRQIERQRKIIALQTHTNQQLAVNNKLWKEFAYKQQRQR